MRNYIQKKITYTECDGYRLTDGVLAELHVRIPGKHGLEQCTKRLRKQLNDENIIITGVSYGSDMYRMAVEDFIDNAELVSDEQ